LEIIGEKRRQAIFKKAQSSMLKTSKPSDLILKSQR